MSTLQRILTIVFFIAIIGYAQAQPGRGFYYQAVLRDAGSNPISEQGVSLRISLHRSTINGIVDYSEIHTVETSPQGIVNLMISFGIAEEGSYKDVLWGSYDYYIELELDRNNNGNYISIGTSRVLSVPYAQYALEAGNANYSDTSATNELQSLSYEDGKLVLTQDGELELPVGLWNSNGDVVYMLNRPVVLGSDSLFDNHPDREVLLELYQRGENGLIDGEKRLIKAYLGIFGDAVQCNLTGNIVTGRDWNDFANAVGIYGKVGNLTRIRNDQTPATAGGAGGVFEMHLDETEFLNMTNTYRLSGAEAVLWGSLGEQPDSAIISGIIATDRINGDRTYAGYFEGKGYFEEAVGIGVKEPARSLHVNDVMRLEPRVTEPTNPQEGDIYYDSTTKKLRVYTGDPDGWQDCF